MKVLDLVRHLASDKSQYFFSGELSSSLDLVCHFTAHPALACNSIFLKSSTDFENTVDLALCLFLVSIVVFPARSDAFWNVPHLLF